MPISALLPVARRQEQALPGRRGIRAPEIRLNEAEIGRRPAWRPLLGASHQSMIALALDPVQTRSDHHLEPRLF